MNEIREVLQELHADLQMNPWTDEIRARYLPKIIALLAKLDGMVLVPEGLVIFLLGEGPIDGVWFGDRHPSLAGNFWWRGKLRIAAAEDRKTAATQLTGEKK